MTIKRIRIPSKWANSEDKWMADTRYGVADFQLGLGTCGKVVTGLSVLYGSHGVTVTQTTEDFEVKNFTYLYTHITGRIEETY